MQLLVSVKPENGHYVASVLGSPLVTANGETQELAFGALQTRLRNELESGKILEMEVQASSQTAIAPCGNIMEGAGLFVGDDTWLEILEEIYRQRDLEQTQELPG